MSDDVVDQGHQEPVSDEASEVAPIEGSIGDDKFDFVQDKYRAEGRSESEALELQAKSYNELSSKFGAFTGAPDEYETALSDELTEAGVTIDSDDPLMQSAIEFAKSSNMSQDGFNSMLNLYAQSQLDDHNAIEEAKAKEMEALGKDGQRRIEGIMQWGNANLDAETYAGLEEAATSAASVKAIEALIAKSRNASVAADAPAAPSVTDQEVREMQFAKDEFGARKINSDPAFKKLYEQKRDALYGTGEHRQVVG